MSDTAQLDPHPGPKLDASWAKPLADMFASPVMANLRAFLMEQKARGKRIFPKGSEYFRALDLTPLDKVRVVILGQDPYHGEGQAHGLSFSVPCGVRPPPSLGNIYKELKSDLGIDPPRHGNLTHWAEQGVLLLNSVLTVELGQAASHQGKGWEKFTDAVIRTLSEREDPMVFALWGDFARKKASLVDQAKHRVVLAPHPSPIIGKGPKFLGSRAFSAIDAALDELGAARIDWNLG